MHIHASLSCITIHEHTYFKIGDCLKCSVQDQEENYTLYMTDAPGRRLLTFQASLRKLLKSLVSSRRTVCHQILKKIVSLIKTLIYE